MYYKPYSNEERNELLVGIQTAEQHLADCRERRAARTDGGMNSTCDSVDDLDLCKKLNTPYRNRLS